MGLVVVVGPPAGGKSTWVEKRARPTDIVIDYDRMANAMAGAGASPHDHTEPIRTVTFAARSAAINAALGVTDQTDVFIIHSIPSNEQLAKYRTAGARIVTIDPGQREALDRAFRERPERIQRAVVRWYKERHRFASDDNGEGDWVGSVPEGSWDW